MWCVQNHHNVCFSVKIEAEERGSPLWKTVLYQCSQLNAPSQLRTILFDEDKFPCVPPSVWQITKHKDNHQFLWNLVGSGIKRSRLAPRILLLLRRNGSLNIIWTIASTRKAPNSRISTRWNADMIWHENLCLRLQSSDMIKNVENPSNITHWLQRFLLQ